MLEHKSKQSEKQANRIKTEAKINRKSSKFD
jgi:hypothetical protein